MGPKGSHHPMLGWGACLAIACTFVGSLYVWPNPRRLERDHPGVIARRFASLSGACALAWVPLWCALRVRETGPEMPTSEGLSLLRALGVASPLGAVTSVAATLGLAAALFLGPLVALALDGELVPRFANAARLDSIHKLRNLVVAPASEEFAFRACMAPLLLYTGAATLRTAILASPLFFGVAHMHHFMDLRRRTGRTSAALAAIAAQLVYTTVFGWFATFAFMRTGHVFGPIAAHAFCNVMGPPDVTRAAGHPRRGIVCAAYAVGITVFVCGLWPATDPARHPSSSWHAFVAISRETRETHT